MKKLIVAFLFIAVSGAVLSAASLQTAVSCTGFSCFLPGVWLQASEVSDSTTGFFENRYNDVYLKKTVLTSCFKDSAGISSPDSLIELYRKQVGADYAKNEDVTITFGPLVEDTFSSYLAKTMLVLYTSKKSKIKNFEYWVSFKVKENVFFLSFRSKKKKELLTLCSYAENSFRYLNFENGKRAEALDARLISSPPIFPGGEEGLRKFIARELSYPRIAFEQNFSARVVIQFMIDDNGDVKDVAFLKASKSLDQITDSSQMTDINICPEGKEDALVALVKEASRVVSAMPRWSPGVQEGNTVSVRFLLPFRFKL
ncbi:MAG: energy transducer TonB [Paludibacteraceae bacterium]|nr:energy transducer TonB [Paludibacteraceae bacterium]